MRREERTDEREPAHCVEEKEKKKKKKKKGRDKKGRESKGEDDRESCVRPQLEKGDPTYMYQVAIAGVRRRLQRRQERTAAIQCWR